MASSIRYALILLAAAGFWTALSLSGLIDGLKQEALRWRYVVRGERASEAPVMFVDLDAPTISLIGDKPWDRRLFGVLVHALLGPGQARVVGLDLIFSRFGTSGLLDAERARAGDEFFGRAVERYPGRIVLGAAFTGVIEDYDGDFSELRLIRRGHLDPSLNPFPEAPTFPILKWGVGRLGLADVDETLNRSPVPSWVPAFVEISGPRYSLHVLDGMRRYWLAAAPTAEVTADGDDLVLADAEGFEIARVPKESSQRLLTLGIELFLAARGLGPESVERRDDALLIRDAGGGLLRKIPLTLGQSLEANWFNRWGNPRYEEHVSMGEVLRRADQLAKAGEAGDTRAVEELEAWFGRFRDAVILVGPVDPALKDVAPTPFDPFPVPKVGLHANIFRTVSEEAFIRRLSPAGDIILIFALTLLVGSLALWSERGRIPARVAAFLVLGGYIGGCYWVFSAFHLVLPLVAPTASVATALLLGTVVKLSAEEWQRRRIRSLFGTYVSPALVDRMVDQPEPPRLGGEECEITALFSDVAGFSSFSEVLSPERLVALMNEYLSAMTEIIQAEGGTLDKYVGDAIIAMYGMPLRMEDHALRASRAAALMQRRHEELRESWRRDGVWPEAVGAMRTRIGLNTGLAVVGNMGSAVRFNYTMMGDAVNLAARCEPAGKLYGVQIAAAEPTVRAVSARDPEILWRRLDRVAVKGRTQAVDLFELWDGCGSRTRFEACRRAYEAALEHYFRGEWAAALDGFASAAQHEADGPDGHHPSGVLAARCGEFAARGTPPGWDGAYRF